MDGTDDVGRAHGTDGDTEIVLGDARGGRLPGRWQATAFDLLVVSYAVGSGVAALAASGLVGSVPIGLLALWAVLVVVEGLTGRSPGKHVAGLVANTVDGTRAGLRESALRRPWGVPLLLTPLGDPTVRLVGLVGAGLLLAAVGVTTLRDPDGRGLHDRLAGTVVRAEPGSRTGRTVTIVVLVVVIVVATAVRATAGGPAVV